MKSTEKITAINSRLGKPFFSRSKSQNLPKSHNPDCLVILSHEPQLGPGYWQSHLASIVEARPGEHVWRSDHAAIQVFSNGDHLYFRNGSVGQSWGGGSILISKVPFPTMTAKLRAVGDPYAWEDPEDRPASYGSGRPTFFGNHGGYGPCETLHILRAWDHFEERGLSWKERSWLLTGYPIGEKLLGDFKAECGRLGLQLGQKTGYQEQFNALDKCLSTLETAFWDRVMKVASIGLHNAKRRNWPVHYRQLPTTAPDTRSAASRLLGRLANP